MGGNILRAGFQQESRVAYSIDLSGRVAFITGASSGLGEQFARTLSRAGAAVVLASRRVEKLKDLRAQIEAEGGDAHVMALDVTDLHSVKAAVAHMQAYDKISQTSYYVDTPGPCTSNLGALPWEKLVRPVYPLDPAANGEPQFS